MARADKDTPQSGLPVVQEREARLERSDSFLTAQTAGQEGVLLTPTTRMGLSSPGDTATPLLTHHADYADLKTHLSRREVSLLISEVQIRVRRSRLLSFSTHRRVSAYPMPRSVPDPEATRGGSSPRAPGAGG